MWTRTQPESAGVIGLAHAQGRWHLAAARPDDAGAPSVDHEAAADGAADDLAAVWAALTSGLDDVARRWPVAWTLPPGRALHRRIALPPADVATTEQLVTVRAEAMLPGQASRVRHGWARTGDGTNASAADGTTWVVLVADDAVARASRLLSAAGTGDAANELTDAVSLPVALAAGQVAAGGTVVAVLPEQTTVVRFDATGLSEVAEIDGDQGDDEPGWLAELGDALNTMGHATPGAGSTRGSERLIWQGEPATPEAVRRWNAALGRTSSAAAALAVGEAAARGAAIAALSERWATVAVADRAAGRARGEVSAKSWVLAGAALLVSLGLWVWSDLHAAGAITDAREQHDGIDDGAATLRRQLDLLSLLERRPPTLLAMLDEFTDRAPGFKPKTLHYDADGDLELTGQLGSPDEIGRLVAALAESRTLDSARLRSQKRDGDNTTYEIVATPSSRFFEAFVPVPKTKDKGEPDKEEQADPDQTQGQPDQTDQPSADQAPDNAVEADSDAAPPDADAERAARRAQRLADFGERRPGGDRERPRRGEGGPRRGGGNGPGGSAGESTATDTGTGSTESSEDPRSDAANAADGGTP